MTPPGNSKVGNNYGGDEPSEFSPGLLDLHAFDTELIPEVLLCFSICTCVRCDAIYNSNYIIMQFFGEECYFHR